MPAVVAVLPVVAATMVVPAMSAITIVVAGAIDAMVCAMLGARQTVAFMPRVVTIRAVAPGHAVDALLFATQSARLVARQVAIAATVVDARLLMVLAALDAAFETPVAVAVRHWVAAAVATRVKVVLLDARAVAALPAAAVAVTCLRGSDDPE